MNRRYALSIIVVLIGCGDSAAIAVCTEGFGNTPVVVADEPTTWREPELREIWRARIGSLATPSGLSVSPEGLISIPDFGSRSVFVLNADGTELGIWAGDGIESAGVVGPVASRWDATGKLTIFDAIRARAIHVADGRFVRETSLPQEFARSIMLMGEIYWASVHADGTVAAKLVTRPNHSPDGSRWRTEHIVIARAGSATVDTIATQDVPLLPILQERPYPGAIGLLAAASPNGEMALSVPGNDYSIRVSNEAGTRFVLCREAEAVPLSASERGDTVVPDQSGLVEALANSSDTGSPHPFGRLFYDADGRLWVQRERLNPFSTADFTWGVAGATYDIFAPDGQYLGQVTAPELARLQSAQGDTVYSIEVVAERPEVVAYELHNQE